MFSWTLKNVLIVDDDLGDTYLLHKTLTKFGVQSVEAVVRGEDAAKYMVALPPFAHRRLPDLIFLDLKMGGMDGFELIAWLKRNPRFDHIPVVVFSHSTDPSDKFRTMELGAKAFYQKTLEADKLKLIVEDVFRLTDSAPLPFQD